MRGTRNTIVLLFLAAVLLCFVMVPATSFGAAAKMRHVVSVYSDNAAANPVQLRNPEGVGCNEAEFIVADSGNGRLLRYTVSEGKVTAGTEIKLFQLMYPLKVLINSKGEIYVLDGKQRRIVHLGSDGRFIDYVEPLGMTSPGSYVPKSFAMDTDDNIYILDIFSARVLVLTPQGEYKREIRFPGEYGFFSDITVDFRGDVLLVDSTNAEVISAKKESTEFSPLTEGLREYMRFPSHILTDARGRVYLIDRNASLIIVLGQDGSFLGQVSEMGWKEGLLNHPSQACLNSNGAVFIADTSNNRVQIFELLR